MFLLMTCLACCSGSGVAQTIITVISVVFSAWLVFHGVTDAKNSFSTLDWLQEGMQDVPFINKPKTIKPLWYFNTGGTWGEILGGIFLAISSIMFCGCVCTIPFTDFYRPAHYDKLTTNPFDGSSIQTDDVGKERQRLVREDSNTFESVNSSDIDFEKKDSI